MKKLIFIIFVLPVCFKAQLEEENYLKTYKKIYFSKNYNELDSLKTEIAKFSNSQDPVIKNSIPNILREIDNKLTSLDFDRYYSEKKTINKNFLIKKYGKKLGEKLSNGSLTIGMTSEMVKDALGEPDVVNNTETKNTYNSQWVYQSSVRDRYYYFENGKLVAIQD